MNFVDFYLGKGTATLVIMTHTVLTDSFRKAVAAIDALDCATAPSVYYPVAD
jgi:hypothetical protein